MAAPNSITINVKLGIPNEVADLCRKVLEMYLTQTPELKLVSGTLPDGTVKLAFVIRDDPRWDGICGEANGKS